MDISLAVKEVTDICAGNRSLNRAKILAYETVAKTMPQAEIPVKHYIHGGMYVREITIPKDTLITGQIYKFDHFDIMISGDVTVSTDTHSPKRFTGYNLFQGLSGKKRAGYAHEDTTWITVHPFDGIDGDDIQEFITAESFEDLAIFNATLNREDYRRFIDDIDMTEQEIRSQVENEEDRSDVVFDYYYVGDSLIEGKGFFAKNFRAAGEYIGLMRMSGKRTDAGRYINHAKYPNAKIKIHKNNDASVFATRDIQADEEITVNYRDVMAERNEKGDLCQE